MRCLNCGHEAIPGAQFCDKCGSRLAPEKKAIFCPHCGNSIMPGDVFCGTCGKSLKDVMPSRAQTQQRMPNSEQRQPRPEQRQPRPEQRQPRPEQRQPRPEQRQPRPEQRRSQTPPPSRNPQPTGSGLNKTVLIVVVIIVAAALVALFGVMKMRGGSEAPTQTAAQVQETKEIATTEIPADESQKDQKAEEAAAKKEAEIKAAEDQAKQKADAEAAKKAQEAAKNDRVIGSGSSPASYIAVYYARVDKGYLALRSAQAFDASNEIGKMNTGDAVYVLDNSGKYWYVYSPVLGKYGYTDSGYLTTTQTAPAPAATTEANVYYAHVNTGYLALRSAQSFDANNEIGKISNGQKVEVLDSATGTEYWWVYVPSLGMKGYVNAKYLTK